MPAGEELRNRVALVGSRDDEQDLLYVREEFRCDADALHAIGAVHVDREPPLRPLQVRIAEE